MAFRDKLFNKLSKGKKADEINEDIIGNVIGFYRTDNSVQVGQFILEVAKILMENGKRVCIIDTNPLSDFYLAKFPQKLSSDDHPDVPSISNRFMNSSAPLSECLIDADDKLKLLTFGTTAYANVFEVDYSIVEKTYLEIKENFDVVLVDIFNMPVMETVTAAMKICSKVYSMWGMGVDSLMQHMKLLSFFSIAELDGKLTNVIINNLPYGTTVKNSYKNLKDVNLNFVLEVPELSCSREVSQNVYILDKLRGKSAVAYAGCIDYVAYEILTGSGGDK